MDKIKELLAQIGASEELVTQICEALDAWKVAQKKTLDEEFEARLVKAKEVCMEEVNQHRQDISRRVEIFLESRVASIERSAGERMAIEESKAVNTLKRTKAMLEGIQIDASKDGDLQAVQSENTDLRRSIVKTAEEKNQFKVKFERADRIAKDALARNRSLEEKAVSPEKPVSESKEGTKLDKRRKSSAKPKTTRRTITESQQIGKQQVETQAQEEDEIASIASNIDELP